MTKHNAINSANVKAEGLKVLALVNAANNAASEKKENVNSFNWLVFQTVLFGNIQDHQSMAGMFSKGGELFTLRMYLSRAKAVAKALVNDNQVTVINKKEKTENVYSLEQVKSADTALFNVTSAYNSLVKEEVTETSEDLALKAFLEANAMTKKDFADFAELNPGYEAEAIKQGLVILADIEKQEKIIGVPKLSETIRAYMSELYNLDKNAFNDTLATCQNIGKKTESIATLADVMKVA